ncbi:hypothetical protein ADIAL_1436 [Alkalibacterium sp. AK22]|nr:hypothetical protein ADIAL_1436 [Alkalibacterium sp. AK22]
MRECVAGLNSVAGYFYCIINRFLIRFLNTQSLVDENDVTGKLIPLFQFIHCHTQGTRYTT